MPPDVTLNDILYWDAVNGAAAYQVRALTSTNVELNPPGVISITETQIGIDQLLTGQPINAQYKLQVRAVEAGGTNPTAWSQLTVNYVGLSQPQNLRLVP